MTYKPSFNLKRSYIQLIFENKWYDYYSFYFFFPFFEYKSLDEEDILYGDTITYSLNFPTVFKFSKSSSYWGTIFQIFGFGIGFTRQTGY